MKFENLFFSKTKKLIFDVWIILKQDSSINSECTSHFFVLTLKINASHMHNKDEEEYYNVIEHLNILGPIKISSQGFR